MYGFFLSKMKILYNYDWCCWGDFRLIIIFFFLEMYICLFDLCGKLIKKGVEIFKISLYLL